MALRAAGDELTLTALGWSSDGGGGAAEERDCRCFDESIEGEGGACFGLANCAVATVDEEWSGCQAVADVATATAAFREVRSCRRHGEEKCVGSMQGMFLINLEYAERENCLSLFFNWNGFFKTRR